MDGSKVRTHKELLTAINFPIKSVDLFFVLGQSNAAGATPTVNPSNISVTSGQAWSSYWSTPYQVLEPFRNGVPQSAGFGISAPWPHFAAEWFARTGRPSIWASFAVAGQPLVLSSVPNTTYSWNVEHANNLIGGAIYTGEPRSRLEMVNEVLHICDTNPGLVKGNTYAIWVQGEADANSIPLNRLTADDYVRALANLVNYTKTVMNISHFFIYELGRKGNTVPDIANNEPAYQSIRWAQWQVANSDPKVSVIFTGAKSTGNLVTSNGYWTSGFDYQSDGVHYSAASYATMGKTGAKNASEII